MGDINKFSVHTKHTHIKYMKNIFNKEKILALYSLIEESQRIVILSHTNPDGDAIGSGLALLRAIRSMGKASSVRFYTPNDMSLPLSYIDRNNDVETYKTSPKEATAYIAASDLIFIVDLNDTKRLEGMSEAIDMNITAPRVLIDHHQQPPHYDLLFHSTDSSSTALLVFLLFESMEIEITKEIAEPLYAGMMTDTGGFKFGNLTSDLFRAVAKLVDAGINPTEINNALLNNQTEDRLRMVGYLLSEKLTIDLAHRSAYITLTLEEKERFNHQIGNTEGIVNIPQTVRGVDFSAIIIENKDHIKLSLRSLSDIDVNLICREHFNGGGHKNAAGGKFFGSLEDAEAKIREIIETL